MIADAATLGTEREDKTHRCRVLVLESHDGGTTRNLGSNHLLPTNSARAAPGQNLQLTLRAVFRRLWLVTQHKISLLSELKSRFISIGLFNSCVL